MADDRDKKFKAERTKQLKRYTAAQREALKDVHDLLAEAEKRIRLELASAPTEFEAWQLPNIQQSIDLAMKETGDALGASGAKHLSTAHGLGIALVDQPLNAGGLRIAGLMPEVDLRQLMAMRSFLIGRMKDVSDEVARKIKSQIGSVMIGASNTNEAVTGIAGMVTGGRSRAITIMRTEMGRAFSVATQERQTQAAEHLPGLQKQWRRSGKIHSRITHDIADGQIVAVDQPFIIDGHRLMYPRDPAAPAKETINCGCVQLPHMAHWEVHQPDRLPFSDEETFKNPIKRDLARELNPTVHHANIETLERLSRPAARRQIADDLAGEDFVAFIAKVGGPAEQRGVAVVPDKLAKAMGAEAGIVRLSSYTVGKQRAHRRGQNFTAADYRRVQRILDDGHLLKESATHVQAFHEINGQTWKAVVKKTENGDEVYLQSLHRSNPTQQSQALAKHGKNKIGGEE